MARDPIFRNSSRKRKGISWSVCHSLQASSILTNHFAIELPDTLYQYSIEGLVTDAQNDDGYSPAAAKRRELADLAVAHSTFLGSRAGTFATDSLGKIVAWFPVPKSSQNSGADIQEDEVVENITFPLRQRPGAQTISTQTVELKYVGRILVPKFTRACAGDIASLPLDLHGTSTTTGVSTIDVVQAINIIIGHGARTPLVRTYQMGSNRFFTVSNDGAFDVGSGLVGRHGFFSTLRLCMGQPLLNISTAASAFYPDNVPLEEYMQTLCNKSSPNDIFTSQDVGRLSSMLKGVRVRIAHENRPKTITNIALPSESPSGKLFQDSNGRQTSVAAYLKSSPQTLTLSWIL